MKLYIFRKVMVAMIIILPVFSWSGCKKQPKCGCDGDVIRTISNELMDRSRIIYGQDGTGLLCITPSRGNRHKSHMPSYA